LYLDNDVDRLEGDALGAGEFTEVVGVSLGAGAFTEVVGVLIEFETEGVAFLILEDADFNAELTLVVAVFAGVDVLTGFGDGVVLGADEDDRGISFINGFGV